MTILFPLTYSDHAADRASWDAGKAYDGKKVTVVTAKGEKIVGRVHRAEQSFRPELNRYGVGFMLTCGSERFPYSVPVNCELQSIIAHREPDYIRA